MPNNGLNANIIKREKEDIGTLSTCVRSLIQIIIIKKKSMGQ